MYTSNKNIHFEMILDVGTVTVRTTVVSTVHTDSTDRKSGHFFLARTVSMVRAKKKCLDFLSTYRYFLSTYVGTSEGTSVGTYCTVRLKHITHVKKFFTRSEQLYIHNSPAVL